jgi:hypothetical protein
VRKLVAIAFILALFGASLQCVADCLTEQKAPPCHQHSQGKNHPAPDPCRHVQTAADQPAVLLTHVSQLAEPIVMSLRPPMPLPVLLSPRDRLLTALRI